MGGKVLATTSQLGDKPQVEQLIGVIKVLADAYRDGSVERVYVVGTTFVNTMTPKAEVVQLLPVVATQDEGLLQHWDYIHEPDPTDLLDPVFQPSFDSQVSTAGEQPRATNTIAPNV